jgi:hypothetical protein
MNEDTIINDVKVLLSSEGSYLGINMIWWLVMCVFTIN